MWTFFPKGVPYCPFSCWFIFLRTKQNGRTNHLPYSCANSLRQRALFYLLYTSFHPLHNTEAAQGNGSTSGLKPNFKMKSSSPEAWPNSGHVAWDKSLDSSKLPVSLLGYEADMVCKVFPILKLNDVCLFLERLSGSSQANRKASAPATGLGRLEGIFKTIEPSVNLRCYYYQSAHTRCPHRRLALTKFTVYLKNWKVGKKGTSKCWLGKPLKIQDIWSKEDETEGRNWRSRVNQRRWLSVAKDERIRHSEQMLWMVKEKERKLTILKTLIHV